MDSKNGITLEQQGGDGSILYQAGGNITVINESRSTKYNQYLKLVEEFEKEFETGEIEFREYIDKIQHYTSNIDDEVIGLEKKLENGGFKDDYSWANEMKEYYFKKITVNGLSRATQKIHAFILARVCINFNLHVRGAINDGVPKDIVRELIISKVVQPIQEMLGENNVLDLYDDDITAMIYFLTGNCHIKWK
jgi:hypothetical protein